MEKRVSLIPCREYSPVLLDQIIERHFAALGADGLIFPGAKVVIKPNLVLARLPDDASTTHPEFIAAIARAVKKRGGEAIIAESPGGPYSKNKLRAVYAATGMYKAAEASGARLNFDIGYREVKAKDGKVCRSFQIIDPIAGADVVISAAKLKTHTMMNYSGAVKNLFGVVPGLMKPEFHFRYPDKTLFGGMIVDLCETVAPAISFIDAVVAMEGNGPTGGTPKSVGMTFAGINPHALDLAACAAAGLKPADVPTLAAAVERGLCPAEACELDYVSGGPFQIDGFKMPDSSGIDFFEKLPPFLRRPLDRLTSPKPRISRANCRGCGVCAQNCPQKTIAVRRGKAVIDDSRCIKCFCCHELCPYKAVKIKRFRLLSR